MAVYTLQDYLISIAILLTILALLRRFLFHIVKLDKYFAVSLVPAIVFGIAVRVLADAGFYLKSDWWSVTPGIYLTACAFGSAYLAASLYVQKKSGIEYWKLSLFIGTLVLPYFLLNLAGYMKHPLRIFYPLAIAMLISGLVYSTSLLCEKTRIFRMKENFIIIFAHLLDGSGTFIGMEYFGFSEEHIIPEMLINLAGSAAIMIPLKLAVILAAIYLIEKWKEEEGVDLYYRIIKLTLFILGIGPGTRNALLLALF
ncbi:MAG: DUF63 family protein [Methanobacteriota archaeon]